MSWLYRLYAPRKNCLMGVGHPLFMRVYGDLELISFSFGIAGAMKGDELCFQGGFPDEFEYCLPQKRIVQELLDLVSF